MKMKLLIFLGILTIAIGGFYLWNIINNKNNMTKEHKLEDSVIEYLNNKDEFSSYWKYDGETDTLYVKIYDSFFENNEEYREILFRCREKVREGIIKHGGRENINISYIINDEIFNLD